MTRDDYKNQNDELLALKEHITVQLTAIGAEIEKTPAAYEYTRSTLEEIHVSMQRRIRTIDSHLAMNARLMENL